MSSWRLSLKRGTINREFDSVLGNQFPGFPNGGMCRGANGKGTVLLCRSADEAIPK